MAGSGQVINYQMRPSKAVERKMMCELIRQVQIVEGETDLRYIGMGAKYFTDFLLFHNELGIQDMISIEAEHEKSERYDFNRPLKNIEMRYGTTNQVLPQIDGFEEKVNVVWLDYDDAFDKSMIEDVETLCRRLSIGSLFFISCNYSLTGTSGAEKMEDFKKRVEDYFDETLDKKMFTSKNIPCIIRMTLNNQINSILTKRKRLGEEIEYQQLMFITYRDGAPMVTIGGILINEELKHRLLLAKLYERFDFLSENDEYFKIEIPRLTYKEMQLILKNIPISDEEYDENKADFHGISLKEFRDFEKIYRYFPFYTEGRINA